MKGFLAAFGVPTVGAMVVSLIVAAAFSPFENPAIIEGVYVLAWAAIAFPWVFFGMDAVMEPL